MSATNWKSFSPAAALLRLTNATKARNREKRVNQLTRAEQQRRDKRESVQVRVRVGKRNVCCMRSLIVRANCSSRSRFVCFSAMLKCGWLFSFMFMFVLLLLLHFCSCCRYPALLTALCSALLWTRAALRSPRFGAVNEHKNPTSNCNCIRVCVRLSVCACVCVCEFGWMRVGVYFNKPTTLETLIEFFLLCKNYTNIYATVSVEKKALPAAGLPLSSTPYYIACNCSSACILQLQVQHAESTNSRRDVPSFPATDFLYNVWLYVCACVSYVCVCVYIPGLHNSNNNNSNNYDNDNGDDPCLKNSLPSLLPPLPLTLSPTHTPLSLCLVSPSVTINRFVAAIVVDLSQLS